MNQIIIKNFKVYAYHGVHDFEKEQGQCFFFDLIVDVPSIYTDDIEKVVSYSDIMKKVKEVTVKNKFNLIEKLACEIISCLFLCFKEIKTVDIVVKKPNAPIKEEFDYVAVRMKKERIEI